MASRRRPRKSPPSILQPNRRPARASIVRPAAGAPSTPDVSFCLEGGRPCSRSARGVLLCPCHCVTNPEEIAITPQATLTAASLVPHLRSLYDEALLAIEYDFGVGRVPVAGFAHAPHDARSVCIGAIDTNGGDPADAVTGLRPLGAPVVFACHDNRLQWWKQTLDLPWLIDTIEAGDVRGFFVEHAQDFAPATIFDGKTRRRLPGQTQLTFIDAGLMPLLEKRTGEALSRLVESVILGIEKMLGKIETKVDSEAAFKSIFWLLAAKILRDKRVPNFRSLRLSDIDDVFMRVGRHYGDTGGLPPGGKAWRRAIEQAASTVNRYQSLAHISTESLAYLYENTLVPHKVRKELATHSTPSAIVDYMVWQLSPWIEELPEHRRDIFEPACGHAAFLVAAMRMLRQWSTIDDDKKRHDYLRSHLHGVEIDGFAIEVARLSLTLADIPHGNRWDLVQGDMFVGSTLEERSASCGVLLANPPFTKLSEAERREYLKAGVADVTLTKPVEMLRRTLPHLTPGACFGVVVPKGFLHNREGAALRKKMLDDFEMAEIDVFADNLFEKADHEVAILLGRRNIGRAKSPMMWFRRVREADTKAFQHRFSFSFENQVDVSQLIVGDTANLRITELDELWRYLADCPKLADLATIKQGISHLGKGKLPKNSWTIHDPPRAGETLGYANPGDDLAIFATPKRVGINMSPEVISNERGGGSTGRPQVLLNYARASRGPWRLRATVDESGLALTSRFAAVRPIENEITVMYLWALLNSPVANAFAYCYLGVDILVGTIREMPVPRWSSTQTIQIAKAALLYRELATSPGPLFNTSATSEGLKRALLEMDAAVLRAYNLPPRLERELLDLFAGAERKGVGCDDFRGYYPPGFQSHLPLHFLISDRFEDAAANRVGARFAAAPSPYVSAVLATAATSLDPE